MIRYLPLILANVGGVLVGTFVADKDVPAGLFFVGAVLNMAAILLFPRKPNA